MKKSSTNIELLTGSLQDSLLFKNFSLNEINEFAQKLNYNQSFYKKGQIIYSEQEPCHHMDLIVTGSTIIQQIDIMGNILSITKFSSGKTIAGNILFSKNPVYPMTITALTDVTLLHLRKKEILNMCSNPQFVESLLMDFSERAAILSHTIKNITRKSLRLKAIDYLCYLYANNQTMELDLGMNKTELANRFGVARPSLSRVLTDMKKDGLLSYDRNTIILDPSFIDSYID